MRAAEPAQPRRRNQQLRQGSREFPGRRPRPEPCLQDKRRIPLFPADNRCFRVVRRKIRGRIPYSILKLGLKPGLSKIRANPTGLKRARKRRSRRIVQSANRELPSAIPNPDEQVHVSASSTSTG